LNHTCQ